MRAHLLSISAFLTVLLLTSCSTLTGVASLTTCKYRLQTITDPRLAGISLSSTQDLTTLNAVTALRVTTGLLAGSLPLSATMHVGITNPNPAAARLEGLDWAVFFEDVNVLSGATTRQVNVPPNGGNSVVPFVIQMDLMEMFRKESKDRMMKFVDGLLHSGESTSKVTLKIRPWINVGGRVVKTGFITVNKDV